MAYVLIKLTIEWASFSELRLWDMHKLSPHLLHFNPHVPNTDCISLHCIVLPNSTICQTVQWVRMPMVQMEA